MANVRANFSESQDFTPLPEAAYHVAITKVDLGKSKEKGLAYLNTQFTVQDGEFTGRNIWAITMLEGKGAFRTRQLLEAVNLECPGDELDFDTDDLLGRELTVTTYLEDYEGKPQTRIKDFALLVRKGRARG